MFGGGLWGGEDENSSALSDYGSQGFGASGEGGAYEQSQSNWTNASNSNDPAAEAAKAAGANLSTEDAGQSVAGGIGRASGLVSAIHQMAFPKAVRLRRHQRKFARAQAAFQLAQANRNLAQYKQDSQIQEQRLAQSYAGRGLGESSIYNEGMQYYRDSRDRKMEELSQQIALSQLNQNLVRSQISNSYAAPYFAFADQLVGVAGGMI